MMIFIYYIIDCPEKQYIAKKVSLLLLCGVQHSVIMANSIMPETHQPIIFIILIIYSVYLLKHLVEF